MHKEGYLKWFIAFLVFCSILAIKFYSELKGYKFTGVFLLPPLLLCIYLAKGHIKFPKSYKQLPLDKLMLWFVIFIFLFLIIVVLMYFLKIPIDFLLHNKGITSIKGLVIRIGLLWIVISLQVYYIWDKTWFNNESS